MSKLADRDDMGLRQRHASTFGKTINETEHEPLGASEEDIPKSDRKTVVQPQQPRKKVKKPYDGDQIPPDWKLAQDHYNARIPGPERDVDPGKATNICDCCGYQVERNRLNLGSDIYEFAFLGSGYPLYFSFIRATIGIIFLLLCISGLYNMGSNTVDNDCMSDSEYLKLKELNQLPSENSEICRRSWISTLSIANKRQNPDSIMIQQILNLIAVIAALIGCLIWRFWQKRIAVRADETDLACSDYTLVVKNIPTGKDWDYDDRLKRFFESRPLADLGGKYPKVVGVNLVYNLSRQTQKTLDKKKAIKAKQRALIHYHKTGSYPNNVTLDKLNADIKVHEDELERLEREYVDGRSKDFAGWAFVSFNTEVEKDALYNQYFVGMKKRALYKTKLLPGKALGGLMFEGNPLFIEYPAEPTDVYWENLHVTTESKNGRRVFANILNLLLLVACAAMIFGLSVANYELGKEAKTTKDEDTAKTNTKAQGLSFLIALIIAIINFLLTVFIKILAGFQKFSTRTSYFITVGRYLGIAQFINTGFLTFLICVCFVRNYYGQGGLFYSQTMVFLTNTFIPPIVKLINVPYWIKKWKRNSETRKGEKSVLTQDEAQALYEDPDFDISVSYAQIVRNLMFCAWYGPNLPQGLVWTLIAMILLYYVEKYTIVNRSTIKYQIGSELSEEMTDLMEWAVFFFALQSFLSDILIYNQKWSPISAVTLLIGIFAVVFPFSFCMDACGDPDDDYERKDYDRADEFFDTDYARENPATSEPATEDWVAKRESRGLATVQKKGPSKNKKAAVQMRGQIKNDDRLNQV